MTNNKEIIEPDGTTAVREDASQVPIPKVLSDRLLRFIYFILGFFLALAALILFVRFSGLFGRGDPPAIIVRHRVVHDTIPAAGFQSTPLSDTLLTPTIWRLWNYEDSILKVRFEAPVFRNFQYWLTLPELVVTTPSPQMSNQSRLGSLSLTTNWENANLSIGYKNFVLGIQYRYVDRLFLPLLGIRMSF